MSPREALPRGAQWGGPRYSTASTAPRASSTRCCPPSRFSKTMTLSRVRAKRRADQSDFATGRRSHAPACRVRIRAASVTRQTRCALAIWSRRWRHQERAPVPRTGSKCGRLYRLKVPFSCFRENFGPPNVRAVSFRPDLDSYASDGYVEGARAA